MTIEYCDRCGDETPCSCLDQVDDSDDQDPEECCDPKRCLCPHLYHRRSECFTLEDARSMALEFEAEYP